MLCIKVQIDIINMQKLTIIINNLKLNSSQFPTNLILNITSSKRKCSSSYRIFFFKVYCHSRYACTDFSTKYNKWFLYLSAIIINGGFLALARHSI